MLAQKTSAQLADELLGCISTASRQKRRAAAEALQRRFGFQLASVEAQLEHCESLLLSHLSTSGGDLEAAVSQLHFLNQAMSHFESSHVVPTYYVTFTICSISGGGVVLRDFWRFTLLHALGFCIGCALCFIGVVLITYQGSVAPEVEVGKQGELRCEMPRFEVGAPTT